MLYVTNLPDFTTISIKFLNKLLKFVLRFCLTKVASFVPPAYRANGTFNLLNFIMVC